MGRGDNPAGFPRPNPTVSYWQLPPHRIANHRTTPSLPTSTTFDYVIVGSGVSGASIAHKLPSHDSSLSILMLEARTAASGASGRNGGHCRAGWWVIFPKYAAAFGEEEAIKFDQLEEQTVVDVADFVRSHAVDCDFQEVETADTFTTPAAWSKVLEAVQLRDAARRRSPDMPPLFQRTVWEGRAAQEHLGMPDLVGAVTYPAHTLNPYRLVCRMLELSLEKGLNLQTSTPALAVRAGTAQHADMPNWEVHTHRGTAHSKHVVLATNGYTNALHQGLANAGFLRPGRSQVTAIRLSNDLSRRPAPGKSMAVADRGSGDYFMIRMLGLSGAGDVLYGGGRGVSPTREMGITDDSVVNEKIAAYLKQSAPEVFGRENWGEQTHKVRDWSGITCYTPDSFPLVGQLPGQDGLWASVGMNGHGMAMAFRCAEALVAMMNTNTEADWLPKSCRISRAWTTSRAGQPPPP